MFFVNKYAGREANIFGWFAGQESELAFKITLNKSFVNYMYKLASMFARSRCVLELMCDVTTIVLNKFE